MERNVDTKILGNDGWLSVPVIKQGFFVSIIIQFFTLTVPFIGWKVCYSPGVLNAYLDFVAVLVVSIMMLAIATIATFLAIKKTDPALLPSKFTRLIQVSAIGSNLAGIILVMYSIVVGFKYAVLPGLNFNASGVFPYILLAIAIAMQACEIIVIWRCFAWTGPASKVITWAIAFACIPIAFGWVFSGEAIFGGATPAALFMSMVMTGVSGFWIGTSDLSGVVPKSGTRDVLPAGTQVVELKGMNVTGFLFLLGMFLFNYMNPVVNLSLSVSVIQVPLILIGAGVAAAIASLGTKLGTATLKNRLYAAIVANINAAVIAYIMDIGDPVRAVLLAVMIGLSAGLGLEPITRAFLKFTKTRRGFAQVITAMIVGLFFDMLFVLLSSAFTTQRSELVPYGNIVFPIMLLLAAVPAFFSVNYSIDVKFDHKTKPLSWIIHVGLIVNFFMLILLIIFPVFAEI